MEKQYVGSLLKRMRKQVGITAGDLAKKAGVSRATISNIENGRVNPNQDTINLIFENLYMDLDSLDIHLLNKEEMQWQIIMDEIDAHLMNNRYIKAAPLVLQLKEDEAFNEKKSHTQYVLFCDALIYKDRTKDNVGFLSILYQAIKIGYSDFNYEYIRDYYLSRVELKIITNIASAYSEMDNLDRAINIMQDLKRNFDENCIDRDYKGKQYPHILYDLSTYLAKKGRLDDALDIAGQGITVCLDTGYLAFLPKLQFNKGYYHVEQGENEIGITDIKQAYFTLRLYQDHDNADIIAAYVKEKFGLIF